MTAIVEFTAWPKIARLNRAITITEKIDGTNAAVGITEFPFGWHIGGVCDGDCGDGGGLSHDHSVPSQAKLVLGPAAGTDDGLPLTEYLIYAQSRKRVIAPGDDNFGFAGWVWDNAEALVHTLGSGLHFGEWWGSGIQRGYGLSFKKFSLFNTHRWGWLGNDPETRLARAVPAELDVVPVLYEGLFNALQPDPLHQDYETPWNVALEGLQEFGSRAAPGFMNPEGIVLFHRAANLMFKVTLQDDEQPKALAERKAA